MAGIQRVQRSVTPRARTYAELRTFTSPVNADLASVLVGDEEGWFVFDDSSIQADDGSNVIIPDDATPGAWIRTDFGTEKMKIATRVDEQDNGNTLYVGEAYPGALTSNAVWSIKKVVFTEDVGGNTDTVITWADGDSSRDNIWDDRLSLTYT